MSTLKNITAIVYTSLDETGLIDPDWVDAEEIAQNVAERILHYINIPRVYAPLTQFQEIQSLRQQLDAADGLVEALKVFQRTNIYLSVKDLITNAPTVQSEGWVSVEDRLPEVKTAVLMLVSCCNYFNIEEGKYSGNGEWLNCWFDIRSKRLYPVTHWQPLPEPPTYKE